MNNIIAQFQDEIAFGEDHFKVEYEIMPLVSISEKMSPEEKEIVHSIHLVDEQQRILDEKIGELNNEIDRLTNHADGTDYLVAASCGVLCGLFDSFFVGEIDYTKSFEKVNEKINNYVEKKSEEIRTKETVEKALKKKIESAKKKGIKLSKEEKNSFKKQVAETIKTKYTKVKAADERDGTLNALRRAISKLEEHYQLPLDNAYKGMKGVNAASHHLDDLAHHPTFLGMMAAIMGSLLRTAIFVDKNGEWHFKFVKTNPKEWAEMILPIIISGILTWILFHVKNKKGEVVYKNIPKPIQVILLLLAETPAAIKIIEIINNWMGHLASDMAGSNSHPGAGMGVPGLFLSALKEVANIPPFNYTGLPKIVDDLYEKHKLDLRAELGYLQGVIDSRQWLPVFAGDLLVRLFYFIKRLVKEIKSGKDLKEIDWRAVIPFNNRTIAKMMLLESGVFSAIDIADAAIRAALKNGTPENPLFWKDLVLRINIVGVGRFAIALGTDVAMGVKLNRVREERMALVNKKLLYQDAIIYYNQELMWISAEKTFESINSLMDSMEQTIRLYNNIIEQIDQNWGNAEGTLVAIKRADPDYYHELSKDLL